MFNHPSSVRPPVTNLPCWTRAPIRRQSFRFLLENIGVLAEPTAQQVIEPPIDPPPEVAAVDQPVPVAPSLSGRKRKAIKLEDPDLIDDIQPCQHIVWHSSFPYCLICLDLGIVKKEDLED
jgi:hypothetical protein